MTTGQVPTVRRVVAMVGAYEEQVAQLCALIDQYVARAARAGKEVVFVYDIDDTVVYEPNGSRTDRPIERVADCFRKYVRSYATYFCTARPLVHGNEEATRVMLRRRNLAGFRRLRMRPNGSKAGPFKWATCREFVSHHTPDVRVVRVGDMLWDTVPYPYPAEVGHLETPHQGHYIELSNGIGILLPTRNLLATTVGAAAAGADTRHAVRRTRQTTCPPTVPHGPYTVVRRDTPTILRKRVAGCRKRRISSLEMSRVASRSSASNASAM